MPIMTLLPLLATVAISAPEADTGFIRRMLSSKPAGNVFADLLVGPDGRVEHCELLYTEDSRRKAERYCEATLGLEAGEPGIGPDGNPAYGVATFDLVVRPDGVPNARVPARPADIEVGVASLPAQYGTRLRVPLVVFVSDGGRVLDCATDGNGPADYVAVACQQLRQGTLPVRHNKADAPVAYVDGLLADFVVEPAVP